VNIASFVKLIGSLHVASGGLTLPEIIEHVVEHSGLQEHYRNEKDGADRLENLAELVNAAVAFVAERDVIVIGGADSEEPLRRKTYLTIFFAHAALEAANIRPESGADALQLMTAHYGKGLEFHSVFISGLRRRLVSAREQPHRGRRHREKNAASCTWRLHALGAGSICRWRKAACCNGKHATTSLRDFSKRCPTH
jgi:superfamily I DNA/RNA helicase